MSASACVGPLQSRCRSGRGGRVLLSCPCAPKADALRGEIVPAVRLCQRTCAGAQVSLRLTVQGQSAHAVRRSASIRTHYSGLRLVGKHGMLGLLQHNRQKTSFPLPASVWLCSSLETSRAVCKRIHSCRSWSLAAFNSFISVSLSASCACAREARRGGSQPLQKGKGQECCSGRAGPCLTG